MNTFDFAIPGPSYNYLDQCRRRPAVAADIPASENLQIPRVQKRKWNYYILESESAVSSDEGSETTLSIQGKETDRARDTSDLDSDEVEAGFVEYEVMSSDEELPGAAQFVDSHQSSSSEDEVLDAAVITTVLTEGDFMFADSEDSMSAPSTDSEISPFDYWKCVQCHNTNNNPMFRYCEKCYKVRKDFFPPPPKPRRRKNRKRAKKQKLKKPKDSLLPCEGETSALRRQSEGTGLNFQNIKVPESLKSDTEQKVLNSDSESNVNPLKRKHECSDDNVEIKKFRSKFFDDVSVINNVVDKNLSLSESFNARAIFNREISPGKEPASFSQPMFTDFSVEPVSKSMSDPAISFKEELVLRSGTFSDSEAVRSPNLPQLRRGLARGPDKGGDLCITCLVEPKSGVFVHGRIAHICCCYKCSVKVWMKTKRCPICNCKVSNVLKAFVM